MSRRDIRDYTAALIVAAVYVLFALGVLAGYNLSQAEANIAVGTRILRGY